MNFPLRLILFLSVGSLSLLLTDNFQLQKIAVCSTSSPADTPLEPPIHAILSQKFHYLAKGSQSYVFASEDGRYVIKLFKDPRKHLYSWTWIGSQLIKKGPRWVWKTLHSDKRQQKWDRHLASLYSAATALCQETGILYAHLEGTTRLNLPLVITDKIHIAHTLALDALPFVLQKRATPLQEHLSTLTYAEKEKCLEAARNLLQAVEEKELVYTDNKIDNWGFVEGRPMLIDLGCISSSAQRVKDHRRIDHFLEHGADGRLDVAERSHNH